ncbi:hypothetical protein [Ornithinimicrobium kibberense]|uniref:hypothetical protein n=1 Tax=Ornithinimicrobium kibberense TaxID=282060 RepID=UPI003611E2D9
MARSGRVLQPQRRRSSSTRGRRVRPGHRPRQRHGRPPGGNSSLSQVARVRASGSRHAGCSFRMRRQVCG